jgi:hypothetical protein
VLKAFRGDEASRIEWLYMREAFLCGALLGVVSICGSEQELRARAESTNDFLRAHNTFYPPCERQ